ncbi:isopeptidase T [Encephalitozoon intestinalis ATCC 50506]|uniref:Isopeptidase T n=1 Tax=Encephalitozoon intestinalis (strain ATCC 50506) TaxID=876142 RepID=E0S666_ENCIT|nr:isopeptidase T [Encephalitozoon intestinalis ATCC 50506]ADM11201.1 isopeptidase T [Encephalitozoon intestinalis ATCC 50506]UTX44868.1 ubiquitin carboxyl-terminal hydrolase [Encephalitozoon intestinalis]
MELPDLSKFREKCCYCYEDIKTGISVCSCGLSFCKEHKDLHLGKAKCQIVFEIKEIGNDLGIEIKNTMLGEAEIEELRRRMETLVRSEDEDERVIFRDEEVVCMHECPEGPCSIDLGDAGNLSCKVCDVKTRLWVCFICGYVGCGRMQYGAEGNGHARAHYEETQHNVFVLVPSLIKESCEVFCYLCDSNIRFHYEIPGNITIDFGDEGKAGRKRVKKRIICNGIVEQEEKKLKAMEKGKNESIPSPYVGIVNSGNTCYISSVLQMIGYVVSKEDIDMEQHFEICCDKNPLECFFCQLMRVLNRMKKARKEKNIDSISILDLIILIWRDMPMFSKFMQQDSHEFLLFLLEKIREGEGLYLIPSITSFFEFEVGRKISCSGCMDKSTSYESAMMICTCLKGDIRRSVEMFFSPDEWNCKCGGKKNVSRFVTIPPRYLIIQVGRYSYNNNKVEKIKSKIGIKSVKLKDFMSKDEADESLAKKLSDDGYSLEDAKRALGIFCNDEGKARSFLERQSSVVSPEDLKYRVVGCINHSGDNIKAGHYTWWVYEDEKCYKIDDTNVLGSNVEVLEDGYIFLFK